jgi:hypothetical protein
MRYWKCNLFFWHLMHKSFNLDIVKSINEGLIIPYKFRKALDRNLSFDEFKNQSLEELENDI